MILCFKAPRAPKAVREPRSYPLAVWKLDFVFDEAVYFLPHWLQTCVPAQDRSNVWFTVPWLSAFWTAVLNNWFWFHMASKRLGGRRRSPLPAHPPHTPPFPPAAAAAAAGAAVIKIKRRRLLGGYVSIRVDVTHTRVDVTQGDTVADGERHRRGGELRIGPPYGPWPGLGPTPGRRQGRRPLWET